MYGALYNFSINFFLTIDHVFLRRLSWYNLHILEGYLRTYTLTEHPFPCCFGNRSQDQAQHHYRDCIDRPRLFWNLVPRNTKTKEG
jgi:hypothetical protein